MWTIAGILIVSGWIAVLEVPGFVRGKRVKDLVVFLLLLSGSTVLSILVTLRVRLPNPVDWITAIHKPISDFIFGTLS